MRVQLILKFLRRCEVIENGHGLNDRVVGGWSKILVVRTKYGDGQAFLRYGWDMATINCSTCHFSPVCGWSSGKTSGECHFWKALCSAGEVLAVGRIAHTIFLIYFFNTSTGREMEELFFISSHLLLGENRVVFHFPPPSAGGNGSKHLQFLQVVV